MNQKNRQTLHVFLRCMEREAMNGGLRTILVGRQKHGGDGYSVSTLMVAADKKHGECYTTRHRLSESLWRTRFLLSAGGRY